MTSAGYLIRRALRLDYGELFRTVKTVSRETEKSKISVLADILKCAARYGAGFNDYLLCRFYDLTDEQRATYVTRGVNERLVSLLNDPAYYHIFDNKSEFYTRFSSYLGRQWLNFSDLSPEDFRRFMEQRETIMAKPEAGSGGIGVEKLSKSSFESLSQMYQSLKEHGIGVIEDVLVQHRDINRLYPQAINSLRITTILNDQGPHILYAFIRIGNHGRAVDNLHSGGMFAPIDLETGKVSFPAYDKARNTYTRHPLTDVEIPGFQIPFWEEAKSLCLKAAAVVPQMRYIGWDVAVTETGPVFIEGNNFPGYDILQMPPHTPDKIGMLPKYREFIPGI